VFDLIFTLFANKWHQSLVRDSKKLGFREEPFAAAFCIAAPASVIEVD
jgi:hypothetical protein